MSVMNTPIIMEESYWANSTLSIARYYGGIVFRRKEYFIVNKDGITLLELSDPDSPHYVKGGMAFHPENRPTWYRMSGFQYTRH